MGLVCCHEYDLFRLLQSSRCYDWQRKYQTLRRIGKSLAILLQQQTSNIVSQIKPCPVPAYLTCNPYGCNGGLNGYGYGYPYGYGDSCCA